MMLKRMLFPGRRYRRVQLVLVVYFLAAVSGCSEKRQVETLTVVFSNDLLGEIRSCGCASDDYGGLGRRATFLHLVGDSAENFLLLEGGDFFSSKVSFGPEKAEITMKSMVLMDYHGVVIGEKDLGFGVDFLVEKSAEYGLPVIVSNLHYADTGELVFPPSRTVTLRNGLNVGLIGVSSPRLKFPPQVASGSLQITDPLAAVATEMKTLGETVDLIVILLHGSRQEAQVLARRFPEVDLVIHGHDGRPMRKINRFGGAYVLQVAKEGRYMGLAFAVLDENRQIRSLTVDNVAMSQAYKDDEEIARLFRAYGLSVAAKEKSDVPPAVFEAGAGPKKRFAGSEACRECHAEQFERWSATRHALAFESLVDSDQQTDRDCAPCHTTGFYKRGGFESIEATPGLVGVGCESCHGNGHDHAKDPETTTNFKAETACGDCHVPRWSPDFDYATAWEGIRH